MSPLSSNPSAKDSHLSARIKKFTESLHSARLSSRTGNESVNESLYMLDKQRTLKREQKAEQLKKDQEKSRKRKIEEAARRGGDEGDS